MGAPLVYREKAIIARRGHLSGYLDANALETL